jgi:hypothetical protein
LRNGVRFERTLRAQDLTAILRFPLEAAGGTGAALLSPMAHPIRALPRPTQPPKAKPEATPMNDTKAKLREIMRRWDALADELAAREAEALGLKRGT